MPEDALLKTFQTDIGIELFDEATQQWEPQKGSELVVYFDEQTNEKLLNMRLSTQSETGVVLRCILPEQAVWNTGGH